jgi:SAM-dependent methyltransferase
MGLVGRQFGNPRGLVGRLVGRVMARGNAAFNQWVIESLARTVGGEPERIVELGCGPGVGLERLLLTFPSAQVYAIDPSPVMVAQARQRNAPEVDRGRLHVVQGDASTLEELAPVDVVTAVHVLYFWHEPRAELAKVRAALRPGGKLGLGFRLREDMPSVSQRQFPAEGHVLYDSDEQVVALLHDAGFTDVEPLVQGSGQGRLLVATA